MPDTHTPGLFTIKGPSPPQPDNLEGGDYAILDDAGEIVAECFHRVAHGAAGVRPARANAALFAAAPDLLRALRDLIDVLDDDTPGISHAETRERVQAGVSAVAKATGVQA